MLERALLLYSLGRRRVDWDDVISGAHCGTAQLYATCTGSGADVFDVDMPIYGISTS